MKQDIWFVSQIETRQLDAKCMRTILKWSLVLKLRKRLRMAQALNWRNGNEKLLYVFTGEKR